eukprot:5858268-Prymnesium_polylepis.2
MWIACISGVHPTCRARAHPGKVLTRALGRGHAVLATHLIRLRDIALVVDEDILDGRQVVLSDRIDERRVLYWFLQPLLVHADRRLEVRREGHRGLLVVTTLWWSSPHTCFLAATGKFQVLFNGRWPMLSPKA